MPMPHHWLGILGLLLPVKWQCLARPTLLTHLLSQGETSAVTALSTGRVERHLRQFP